MTKANEDKKKHNWKYKSKDVLKDIESHSTKVWINRTQKYVKDCIDTNHVPRLASFYKEYGLWIYYLRDDFAKDKYKDRDDGREKYNIVKKIIDDACIENVVGRNIDKSAFAVAYLQNEHKWSQNNTPQMGGITLNLTNFALPDPTVGQKQLTDNIIDAELVEDEPLGDDIIDLKDTLNNLLGDE